MSQLSRVVVAGAASLVLVCLGHANSSAQPGGTPPPPPGGYYGAPTAPGGFHYRRGFTAGVGIGIGGMSSDSGPIECFDCDYNPAAVSFHGHLGGMLNPRLALMGEIWASGQAIDSSASAVLVQTMAMLAVQYWVNPRVWLKGGLGAAHLSVSVDDGFVQESLEIDNGLAIMGAVGYELVANRQFSVDLQLRLGSGQYDGIDDQVHVGAFQVGVNWF